MEDNRIGNAFLHSARFRAVLISSGSLFINIAYAFYNGVLGIMDGSVWFLNMSVYYIVLSVMRYAALMTERKAKRRQEDVSEEFAAFFTGIMLILLGLILSGVVCYSTMVEVAKGHGTIVMIVLAAYTFYKVPAAIVNLVKVKAHHSPLMTALRDISCADAAASVLSLQRSMLASFEGMETEGIRMMNRVTGAFVCGVVLILGIFLCVRYRKTTADIIK